MKSRRSSSARMISDVHSSCCLSCWSCCNSMCNSAVLIFSLHTLGWRRWFCTGAGSRIGTRRPRGEQP
ncbi:unnamed protein product [Amoebophrya sp. A120]|nr:unnamed protein product [Amoebophrya sp. A120]|eukprot:GSA120T00018013001.1